MEFQATSTQASIEKLAEESSLIEFMHITPMGQDREIGNVLRNAAFGAEASKVNYSSDSLCEFEAGTKTRWIERYLELLEQSEYQSYSTQIAGWINNWQTLGGHPRRQRISWRKQITVATKQEEVFAVLRLFNLDGTADRLVYLQRLALDDPDEQPMLLDSMRELVLFLMSERQLPDPQIGISPDGNAQVEWKVGESGLLAMEFLPTSLIRFAAISASAHHSTRRKSVSGTLEKTEALRAVEVFTSQIMSDAWQSAS